MVSSAVLYVWSKFWSKAQTAARESVAGLTQRGGSEGPAKAQEMNELLEQQLLGAVSVSRASAHIDIC